MREGALFGTMFGLGAGAVLVGVTVSRLVVGQPGKAEEPPAVTVETASPAATGSAPAVVSPIAPAAEIALAGQHRALPRKHRRPPVAEVAMPRPKPILEQTPPATAPIAKRETPTAASPPSPVGELAPPATASIPERETATAAPPPSPDAEQAPSTTASIANREAPTAAPARAEVPHAPIVRAGPIAIVRGGVARAGSPASGPRIIRVEPQSR